MRALRRLPRVPEWAWAVAVALAISGGFFWRAVFSRGLPIQGDLLRVYYPLKAYWRTRVLHGEFPAWYPFDGLGQPFLPMLLGQVLHPFNLLFLILSPGRAMTWMLVLGFTAAASGTFFLLRGTGVTRAAAGLGAVTFAFCGYLVSMTDNPVYLLSAAAVPWALAFVLGWVETRRPAKLLGAALGLVMVLLGGDPEAFAVCGALAFLVGALARNTPWRWRLAGAATAVLAAAGLGAVQLWPSLAVNGEAWVSRTSMDTALRFSGSPWRGLEAVLGPLWLNGSRTDLLAASLGRFFEPAMGNPWANSEYVGVVGVLLAGWAVWAFRRRWRAQVLGAVFVLLALLWSGRHAGLYGLFHQAVPLWHAFRYPEKLAPFWILAIAVAAAWGLEDLLRRPEALRGVVLLVLGALLLLCGLALVQDAVRPLLALPGLGPAAQSALASNLIRCSLESAGWLGLLLLALYRWRDFRTGPWVVVALQLASLFWAHSKLLLLGDPAVLFRPPVLASVIAAREGGSSLGRFRLVSHTQVPPSAPPEVQRVALAFDPAREAEPSWEVAARRVTDTLRADTNMLWGLESADTYLPTASARLVASYRPFADGGLFNTRYMVMLKKTFELLGWPQDQLAHELPGLALVRTRGYTPRAYLARPVCVRDLEEALRGLRSPELRRGVDAVVECPLPFPPAPAHDPQGAAQVVSYRPESVALEAQSDSEGLLVLNDAFYSGWSATVDAAPAPILPTNGAVRGVRLTAGRHRIVFRYRTPGLLPGAVISGLALLLLLLGAALVRRRDAQEDAPALDRR